MCDVVEKINSLVDIIKIYCSYDKNVILPPLTDNEFEILESGLISSASAETLISFARDSIERVDISKIEAQCWRLWDLEMSHWDTETDVCEKWRVLFEQYKLALLPGVNVGRLEAFLVEHPSGGDICRFADEVPGANVKRLEDALFAITDSTRAWHLSNFASVKGANVEKIQEVIIESGDPNALSNLLTGGWNMDYREPPGVDKKAVLDAIRILLASNDPQKKFHPITIICLYEKAKEVARRLGEPPIVAQDLLDVAKVALMSPSERASGKAKKIEQLRLLAQLSPSGATN